MLKEDPNLNTLTEIIVLRTIHSVVDSSLYVARGRIPSPSPSPSLENKVIRLHLFLTSSCKLQVRPIFTISRIREI